MTLGNERVQRAKTRSLHIERPMSRRFVIIDIETNGFTDLKSKDPKLYTLPWQNFPCQLSVDVVDEEGDVYHAFDTYIRGATRFSRWSTENLNFSAEEANESGIEFSEAINRLAALITPETTIVAHNVDFDVEKCLARTAKKLQYDSPELNVVLTAPRFCTCKCAYSKLLFKNKANLGALCRHFEIDYCSDEAHGACYDSNVLAKVVAEALRRGVML